MEVQVLSRAQYMVIQIILFSLVVLITTIFLVIYILFLFGSLITNAPLVLIRTKAVGHVIETLNLKSDSVFYDLGCGNGKILIASLSKNPSKIKGIEYSPIAFLWAKLRTRTHPKIQIIRENVLTSDVHDATHIFVYLFPGAMSMLEKRFDSQLQEGTRVVSCDFTFPHKQIVEEIDISVPESKLARKLFVYEW